MSGDDYFDDDDDDGFFDEPKPQSERPLGLVVPEKALVALGDKGEVIFDGLANAELNYRFDNYATEAKIEGQPAKPLLYAGMTPPLLFDGNDNPDGEPILGDPDPTKAIEYRMKWRKFLKLDREPTYQEAEDAQVICWMLYHGRVSLADNALPAIGRVLKLDKPPTMEEGEAWVAANRY